MEKTIKTSKEISAALAKLPSLSVKELHGLHAEIFDKVVKTRNKPFLQKKLTTRLEEMRRIAQRTKQIAGEKTEKAAKRALPRKTARRSTRTAEDGKTQKGSSSVKVCPGEKKPSSQRLSRRDRDPRLPAPGTVLSRTYKGTLHEVTVRDEGFEYNGEPYRSLSRIATEIAGSNWNGFRFFKDSLEESSEAAR